MLITIFANFDKNPSDPMAADSQHVKGFAGLMKQRNMLPLLLGFGWLAIDVYLYLQLYEFGEQ